MVGDFLLDTAKGGPLLTSSGLSPKNDFTALKF